jgi:hypothetical protein
MKTNYLALEVEEYASRPQRDTRPPTRESVGVSIRGLVVLTIFLAAFMALAVHLGQIAGAC